MLIKRSRIRKKRSRGVLCRKKKPRSHGRCLPAPPAARTHLKMWMGSSLLVISPVARSTRCGTSRCSSVCATLQGGEGLGEGKPRSAEQGSTQCLP